MASSSTILLTGGLEPIAADADYMLAPDAALLVTSHGNAFAFDMRNSFYALSAMGATMLERALRQSEAAAAASIATEYEAAPETVEADLRGFLTNLETRGIILKRAAVTGAARPSRGANILARIAKVALGRLSSPSARAAAMLTLTRLSFACFGWVSTLAAWKAHAAATQQNVEDDATLHAIDGAVKSMSAKLPLGSNCKERALSCWALAQASGISAKLVVGVVQYPLAGHTWCETLGGTILGDDSEHCAPFLPVFRYE